MGMEKAGGVGVISVDYFTFHIQSGTEFLQVLGPVACEADADGDSLLHLHEISCRVVLGDEAVGAPRGIRYAFDDSAIFHLGHGIHFDADRGSDRDVCQLGFPIVGLFRPQK